MTLEEKIEKAFAHRAMPASAVDLEGCVQFDSDVEEGLWFIGRDRHSLTAKDWDSHSCGMSYLSAEAFRYFLPGLLILTVRDPGNSPHLALFSLLHELDRSPGIENLHPMAYRYADMTDEEFDVFEEWLVWASENIPDMFYGMARNGPGDGYGRVLDSIKLIREEIELEKMSAREKGQDEDSAAQ